MKKKEKNKFSKRRSALKKNMYLIHITGHCKSKKALKTK